jgi:hypothetical protein
MRAGRPDAARQSPRGVRPAVLSAHQRDSGRGVNLRCLPRPSEHRPRPGVCGSPPRKQFGLLVSSPQLSHFGGSATRTAGFLSNGSTRWRDERAENPAGQQELQICGEAPRAVPASAAVEELPRTQRRPRHFRLDPKGAGGSCTPPNSGELTFREHRRAFYIFYGFGRSASTATHAKAMQLLDSLRIEPPLRR